MFIDDDEVPSPEWLKHLAACQQAYGADVVSGPVIPHFMSEVPQWITAGRFFERPRYATGTVLPEARTGNVLIRMEVFHRIGLFDDRFALTGGEDMDFFVRLYESGGLIFWADEASCGRMGSGLSCDFEIRSSAGVPDRKHHCLSRLRVPIPCAKVDLCRTWCPWRHEEDLPFACLAHPRQTGSG